MAETKTVVVEVSDLVALQDAMAELKRTSDEIRELTTEMMIKTEAHLG